MKTEVQIKKGVYITPITKKRYMERLESLQGEDKAYFMFKCVKFSECSVTLLDSMETTLQDLFTACKAIEPDLDPETDFFAVRYFPPIPSNT